MTFPSVEELESAAKKLVWTAQKQGNLGEFTPRVIIQTIEKQFNLEEGSLYASEHRSTIKAAAKDAAKNLPPVDTEEVSTRSQSNKKRKSDESTKEEVSPTSSRKAKPSPKAISKGKSKALPVDEEVSDVPTPKKKRRTITKAKKVASDEEEEDDGKPNDEPGHVKLEVKTIVPEDSTEKKVNVPKSGTMKPKSKQNYKSAEHVATSDMEQDEAETVDAHKPTKIRKQATSPGMPRPLNTTPQKRAAPTLVQAGSSKSVNVEDDAAKSESELSVLIDEPPKRKRKKLTASEKVSKFSEKQKKQKKATIILSKDEETIKRLKSLVVACGTRKVWSRVFQDEDTQALQIKKLKAMLAELGMTGRPSMEQAKAIKEKRDLEQELADVKEFAEKMESRSRATAAATEDSQADEGTSSEDDEVEAPKKRPMNARKSIMAFLGDQSDEE